MSVHLAPEITVTGIYLVPLNLFKHRSGGSVTEKCGKRVSKKQEIDVLSKCWPFHAKDDTPRAVWDSDRKMASEGGVALLLRNELPDKRHVCVWWGETRTLREAVSIQLTILGGLEYAIRAPFYMKTSSQTQGPFSEKRQGTTRTGAGLRKRKPQAGRSGPTWLSTVQGQTILDPQISLKSGMETGKAWEASTGVGEDKANYLWLDTRKSQGQTFTNACSRDPIQVAGSLKFIHLGQMVLLKKRENTTLQIQN